MSLHRSRRLRVLMVNRADARRISGGDVVQLQMTCEALERLGVEVVVRLSDELDATWDFDLVHIFNIQSVADSWHACQLANEHGLPVALSTIYWEMLPLWYWANANLKGYWRTLRRVMGKNGYPLFALWQRSRYSSSSVWQMQRRLLMAADVLLPNSELEAQQVIRDFRLPETTNYKTVPNAVDAALFSQSIAPDGSIRRLVDERDFVLQVGRISPEKNTLGLIEALWSVDVPIVFVGQPSPYDPNYAQECYLQGRRRGNVHFVDGMPHRQVLGLFAAAAVHALPSWRETPGLASLEAAATGCNIVSTSIGSVYEYFGDEAWYCAPYDKSSIRRAVLGALKASQRHDLRRRILNEFTWDVAAEKTVRAYQEVLEGMS